MAQNVDNTTPTTEELKGWADQYGMTFPVTADDNWTVDNEYEVDHGIPTQVLLAPGDKVLIRDSEVQTTDIEGDLP